jgi:hypothetical protein
MFKIPEIGDRVLDSMGVAGHIVDVVCGTTEIRLVRTTIHVIPVHVLPNGDEWIVDDDKTEWKNKNVYPSRGM